MYCVLTINHDFNMDANNEIKHSCIDNCIKLADLSFNTHLFLITYLGDTLAESQDYKGVHLFIIEYKSKWRKMPFSNFRFLSLP